MFCQVLKVKTGPKFRIATVQAGNLVGECLAAPGVEAGPGKIRTEFRTVAGRLQAVVKVYPVEAKSLELAA